MASLQKKVYLQAAKSGQLGSHTKHLADYVERFVREFLMFGDAIAKADQEIEPSAVEKLLRIAAERSIADSASATSEDFERVLTELRAQWEGFRSWFISRPGSPSRAEILRGQARASITRLLSLTTSINDTQIGQIDRTNDFRILARWFAEAESDGAAHLLWRSAFGLSPARHLMINELTLDDQEAQDAGADASWLDAPPMRISQRLRSSGSYSRSGRLSRIVDRTAEKEKLADTLQQEAMRILSAQSRFASCGRLRLSDLDQLEGCEFDLFLDLLGEAISASAFAPGAADILSNDSGLCVRLEPAGDGRVAVIHTPEGTFSGPDFWISVEPVSAEEVFR